jgi:hypothetical protein
MSPLGYKFKFSEDMPNEEKANKLKKAMQYYEEHPEKDEEEGTASEN